MSKKNSIIPNFCIKMRKGSGKELTKMVFNPANVLDVEILPALDTLEHRKTKETALHKLGKHKKVKVCLYAKRRRKKR